MGENWAAPSGGGKMKLPVPILQAPPTVLQRQNRENREKSPKCTKNDQFRQTESLNLAYFHSSYTSFDAELQVEFFELLGMFVTLFVLALLTKTRSGNRRRNIADPMATEKALLPGPLPVISKII